MPFDVSAQDASTAVLDPYFPARAADSHRPIHPTAHAAGHGESRPPAAEEDGSIDGTFHGVAPVDTSAPAVVPFYCASYPRPVCAIAPRVSRGVI